MGFVFRPSTTRPVPPNAVITARGGERVARWRDARGQLRTARITTGRDGLDRIIIESRRYTARYKDGDGILQTVPTGCRDETAARRVLSQLEARAERVKAGLLTRAESATIDHQGTPLVQHILEYLQHLEARGTTVRHRLNVKGQLARMVADCCFVYLSDLDRTRLENWLVRRAREGMGARTRNTHLAAIVGFANWCVRVGRLVANPFTGLAKADEKSDPRRQRRSLTEEELTRLLDAARRRPLEDALTVRRGKRKGQLAARLSEAHRRRFEALGEERALIYKVLVLTGLRKGELASLTVGSLDLSGPIAFVTVQARHEKSRRGADIPLRADLADDIRALITARLRSEQAACRRDGLPVPLRLASDQPLLRIPQQLFRILDRDLVAAGIAKRDERGRTVDVHALRHTFGTHLSKAGVPLRTAQAAMRHSDPSLTANVYTDPKLLDVRGALDALPKLPLRRTLERGVATGTHGDATPSASPFVLPFILKTDRAGPSASTGGQTDATSAAPDPPPERAQPPTLSTVVASCPPGSIGSDKAGEGIRTLDVQLGRLTLYH